LFSQLPLHNTVKSDNIIELLQDIVNDLHNDEIVEKECKMEEKYVNRVDNFFKYIDCNNCERIYNEILKLK
jgi:hypothetical protein